MRPPVYFISYSRKNLSQTKLICETLTAHGINCWQDISNLGHGISEHTIRSAISAGTDGLVLLATPESMASTFIRTIELTEADSRMRRDGNFHIIPVFGMPYADAAAALKDCLTVPLSNFNGVKVNASNPSTDMLDAANRVAEIILDGLSLDRSAAVPIGLSSKQAATGDIALHLNFLHFFAHGLPTKEIWAQQIAAALTAVKNALVRKGIQSLSLKGYCHLSLGCLFGYTFRQTSGFRFDFEQNTAGKAGSWASDCDPQPSPLTMKDLPGDLSSQDLVVVLNLMSSDIGPVLKFTSEHPLPYRAALIYSPSQYPCMVSGPQAVTIARSLAQQVKEAHARYRTNKVHLFLAVPLGLSVLIGFNLNACGSIQCYEFDNGLRQYFPSCNLA